MKLILLTSAALMGLMALAAANPSLYIDSFDERRALSRRTDPNDPPQGLPPRYKSPDSPDTLPLPLYTPHEDPPPSIGAGKKKNPFKKAIDKVKGFFKGSKKGGGPGPGPGPGPSGGAAGGPGITTKRDLSAAVAMAGHAHAAGAITKRDLAHIVLVARDAHELLDGLDMADDWE